MSSDPTVKTLTIEEFSQAIGVSRSQISTAFTGKGRIAGSTRDKVLLGAQALGYRPNPHAQRLANGGCHNMVGFFALNLDLGVGTRKVQQIQFLLGAKGYDVPLYSYSYVDYKEVLNQRALMRALCEQKPRAIVCKWGNLTEDTQTELDRYLQAGGIVVTYGYDCPLECDQVIYDEGQATYLAARHLIELGHTKLGFSHHGRSAWHWQGFKRALDEAGLPLRPEWEYAGGLREDGGGALAKTFLESEVRPTGLCIINDVSASAFVNEVARRGVRVPRDVSLVGQDDTPAARYCAVPLTTVSEPVEAIAHAVAELLTSRLEGIWSGAARRVTVPGALVVRESTAHPQSVHNQLETRGPRAITHAGDRP